MEYPTNSSPRATTPSVKLIALAVLVLLIALAVWFAAERGLFVPRDKETLQAEREALLRSVVASGDPSRCEEVDAGWSNEDIPYRDVCVNNIALARAESSGDLTWCSKVKDPALREFCAGGIIARAVSADGDVAQCDAFSEAGTRASCVSWFWQERALATGAPELCANVAEQTTADFCRDRVLVSRIANGGDVDCDSFKTPSVKGDCALMKEAVAATSSEARQYSCSLISSLDFQALCR